MRVIAGSAKGTRLFVPRDRGIRPSTDRTRQVLFDTLPGNIATFEAVLDLFAGSGAIGIEALSRGAAKAWFVEKSRPVAQTLIRNLEKTHLKSRSQVVVTDAFSFLNREPPHRFDCIFADPPYQRGYGDRVLEAVLEPGWLAGGGLCVVEESRHTILNWPEGLKLLRRKQVGDSILYFFVKEG